MESTISKTNNDRTNILCGDCIDIIPTLDAESIDAIITDPPYGLKFMGEYWDHGVPGVHFWESFLKVCKPGAHLLAFGGTRTFHRLTCAIEDAGWEIRDCLGWIYGSGFPKSHNIGNGFGTALKPAWEPIILARKPLVGTVAANVKQYGTGALNIDGCKVKHNEQAARIKETLELKPSGRWPANVIHDGSEEVVRLFPEQSSGEIRSRKGEVFTGNWRNFEGRADIGRRTNDRHYKRSAGSAARFFYCAKASTSDRNEGLDDLKAKRSDYRKNEPEEGYGGNDLCARLHKSTKRVNHHPTVKPTPLMRYLCRLITPTNGTILDPFMGSGSTGKAAALEGYRFVGIEINQDYVEIAKRRIMAVPVSLFAMAGV